MEVERGINDNTLLSKLKEEKAIKLKGGIYHQTLIIVILVDTKVHIRNIIFQRHHIVRLSSYLKNGEQLQLTVRR